MSYHLNKSSVAPQRKGPCVLIVLDGIGIGKEDKGNAFLAAPPEKILKRMEEAKKRGLYTELFAHGKSVGLPSDGDMGNSEVGHNALGAGQIYSQGAKLVNESLDSGDFFKTEVWTQKVVPAAKIDKTVHFIGLLSDGNIHSHIDQLFKMMDGAERSGFKKIRLHVLLDGRDVPPTSSLIYIEKTEKKCAELQSRGVDARIASGGGRMAVTMDRYYSDWKTVERGWKAHVLGEIDFEDSSYNGFFISATEAINKGRELYPDRQDQFHPPFVIIDEDNNPIGKMQDGDVVINFNFRGDRAIELSEAFEFADFSGFDRGDYPQVTYVGLLEYDGDRHLPKSFLVPPPLIENVSSQYFCAEGIRSFAIAETHKYGHVTYFWNGNRSGKISDELETYVEVPSDPSEEIEFKPEMKAKEVADLLIEAIKSGKYDYLRANFANGDMVGHTGNFAACQKSVLNLDEHLERVLQAIEEVDGVALVTADHGNVEEELDKNGKPMTSHTLNKVPFFIVEKAPFYKVNANMEGAGIANVIATTMEVMGYVPPEFYRPSLLVV